MYRLTYLCIWPGEQTNPGTDGDEVVTIFAPRFGGFLAVLRHSWSQQWREEDEDAVCYGTTTQVSDLVSKWNENLASHGELTS